MAPHLDGGRLCHIDRRLLLASVRAPLLFSEENFIGGTSLKSQYVADQGAGSLPELRRYS